MEIVLAALIAAFPATLAAIWSRRSKHNTDSLPEMFELHTEQDALNFLVLQQGQQDQAQRLHRIEQKVGLS